MTYQGVTRNWETYALVTALEAVEKALEPHIPRREHGVPVDCCETCGKSTDDPAHIEHCR